MDIEDWRKKIDIIDDEILRLLNKRAQFTIEIGHIKNQKQLPIHSPEREESIIKRIVNENSGPLGGDGVRRVFERIIDESRKLEKDVLKNVSTTNPKKE
ncbi:MAG: chorismate mutase [bacterium]